MNLSANYSQAPLVVAHATTGAAVFISNPSLPGDNRADVDNEHVPPHSSPLIGITSSILRSLMNVATSTAVSAINSSHSPSDFSPNFSPPFLVPSQSKVSALNDPIILPTTSATLTMSLMNSLATSAFVTSSASPTFEEPPVDDWCFDLIIFYRSIAEDDAQAFNVLKQLETYSKFSFVLNGIVTCMIASFGLLGNILFVSQLYKSRYFSRRLASHLAMLCAWDMALLLCCLLTYGIMASYYGILPFVGIVAYLLYFFQPFASFCVTGTIWQVLAITLERYTAVSRPLEQRTRNAQFSLRTICGCIIIGAFVLNMVVVPFERRLTDCYEFTQSGYQIRTMIVQQDLVNNHYYAILAHLVPDIIFRAPTPIIVIAILTVRTLQICARRTVGTQTIHRARRNVPFMLTLLNIKFIMCNTLYMFNTILMEVMGYGGKTNNQQTELEMEQYVKSLYLTDFSNMLLAIHSATNWLIFYHWPRFSTQQRKKKLSSLTLTSNAASKTSSMSMNFASSNFVVDADTVEALAERFSLRKYEIATKILTTLCFNSQQISRLLTGNSNELNYQQLTNQKLSNTNKSAVEDSLAQNVNIQKHANEVGDMIEKVLNGLANKSSIFEWRDMCRRIGYANYKINLYFSATEWKLVRNVLIESMSYRESKYYSGHIANKRDNCANSGASSKSEKNNGCSCCLRNSQQMWHPKQPPKRNKFHGYSRSSVNFLSEKRQSCTEIFGVSAECQLEREFGLSNLQRAMCKAFNFALREMKSGALCAIVDASRCHKQHVVYPQRSLNFEGSNNDFATTSTVENSDFKSPEKRLKSTLNKSKTPCHKVHSDFSPCMKNAERCKRSSYVSENFWSYAYDRDKCVNSRNKHNLNDESFGIMSMFRGAANFMPRRCKSERHAAHWISQRRNKSLHSPQRKANDEEKTEKYRRIPPFGQVIRRASNSSYMLENESLIKSNSKELAKLNSEQGCMMLSLASDLKLNNAEEAQFNGYNEITKEETNSAFQIYDYVAKDIKWKMKSDENICISNVSHKEIKTLDVKKSQENYISPEPSPTQFLQNVECLPINKQHNAELLHISSISETADPIGSKTNGIIMTTSEHSK